MIVDHLTAQLDALDFSHSPVRSEPAAAPTAAPAAQKPTKKGISWCTRVCNTILP